MSDFFCAAPWRGLHINPRGDVKTCCAGDPNMLGNLNDHTIQEILHGPVMQEIRHSIRQGQPHAYCYNCVQAERYGRSERDWHNSVNADFNCQAAADDDYVPTLIDVRWNITCNLSCNYCGDKCSSRWAALKKIPFRSGTRPYYEQVCDFLAQHAAHIREVALVGGEPLLLPENERLLDVLPRDCVVTLITNVSVDFQRNPIVKKLRGRHRVGWSMSFDNVGARFEYVRHGANWYQLMQNIGIIQDLMRDQGHWGGIHAVYNIYNATRLIEFTQFARGQGLTIHWQSLYQPEYLDPVSLGRECIDLVQQEIDRLLAQDICLPAERDFFQSVRNNRAASEDRRPEFRQHIKDMEQIYHPDKAAAFLHLWPELAVLCR